MSDDIDSTDVTESGWFFIVLGAFLAAGSGILLGVAAGSDDGDVLNVLAYIAAAAGTVFAGIGVVAVGVELGVRRAHLRDS